MKRFGQIALLICIGGLTAFAAPLCTSFTSLTAADMQGLGSVGCQFGDKLFYNFTYDYTVQDPDGNNLASDVPASAVLVEFSNLNGNPLQPILSLVGTWQTTNGNAGDVAVHYQVSAPLSAAMYFSWVKAYGSVSNTDPQNDFSSYISVAESVCCPGGSVTQLGVELDPPSTTSGLTPIDMYDGLPYAPATMIQIGKDIYINSGTGANQAIFTRIDQGIYELGTVPEPVSSLLLGGGLMLLGLLGNRRRTKTQTVKLE